MIFHWVGVEHSTAYAVVKRLYEQGIKPRKMKRDIWTKGPITRMLTNETYYKGEIYFNKTESVMPKKPLKDLEYRKIKKTSRVVG